MFLSYYSCIISKLCKVRNYSTTRCQKCQKKCKRKRREEKKQQLTFCTTLSLLSATCIAVPMPEVTISVVDSEPVNFDVGGWLRSPAGCLRSDKAETALLLFWFDKFSVKLSTMTIFLIWLIVYYTFNAKWWS